MKKFAFHNCDNINEADVVMIGIPDERGSLALRHGAAEGPQAIRRASRERLMFIRNGAKHFVVPERGSFSNKLYDVGDVKKEKLEEFISGLNKKQLPIVLGGDHSNTYLAIKGLLKKHKEIGVIYFDAHPDYVHSEHKKYYGSVVYDLSKLKGIQKNKIIEVGIRSIEPEEMEDIRKRKITSFTALDVFELGVEKVFSGIKKKMGNIPFYLSIDLDVIDPSFAPGVDTPASFGLSGNEYLSLIKKCAELNLVGFDIMEMSPKYDIQQRTAQIAAQSILEILASKKK